MKIELTPRLVDTLAVERGRTRTVYLDTHPAAPPGFALRVTKTGARTFYLLATVPATGRRVWVKIGPAKGAVLDQARRTADARWGDVQRDKDPNAEARAARRLAAEERKQRFIAETEWTVTQLLEAHLAVQRKDLAPLSIRHYELVIIRDVKPSALGDLVARHVVREDVRRWLHAKEKKDGPTSAIVPLNRVRSAFRWALDEEMRVPGPGGRSIVVPRVDKDPTRGLKPAQRRSVRARVLADGELAVYWRKLDEAPIELAAFARLILLSATRRTETFLARWANVKLETPDEYEQPEWFIPAEDRKGERGQKRSLTVPLSPLAVAELKRLREKTGESPRVFGPRRSDSDLGDALHDATGIRDVTLHDLRRTCATGLQKLGAPPHVISVVLGHIREHGATATDAAYTHDRRAAEHRAWLERWAQHIERLLGAEAGKLLAFR